MEEFQSEAKLQQEICVWFWNTYPELRGLLAHNYNNPRNKIQGAILKGQIIKGRPDLELQIPCEHFGSLYIELKDLGEKPKPYQYEQMRLLAKHRNKVYWTDSFICAKHIIIDYLSRVDQKYCIQDDHEYLNLFKKHLNRYERIYKDF